MPRKFHRLIVNKEPQDLRLILEQLALHVDKNGGLKNFNPVDKTLLDNVLSNYRKFELLSQEEINLIWETASSLVKELLKSDPKEMVDKIRSDAKREDENILIGNYWILPSGPRYVKCGEDYLQFVKDNSEIFVEGLGIDGMDFIHALSTGQSDIMQLVLRAGGIIANFEMENNRKTGNFQLCKCSLPWLRAKLSKMPIIKSYVRIVDGTKPYAGEKSGMFFIYRRPKKIKAKD